ncbi:MAG: glycoside hydrolase family 5 protein [Fibrobacterales bacterium]
MKHFIIKASLIASVILSSFSNLYAEGPVEVYGEMKVKGQYIAGSKAPYTNAMVQAKGLSFFWNQWGGENQWNASIVDKMVDEYNAEVLRVPVSTSSGGKYADLGAAAEVINRSIERGIYIIIDFHSHYAWGERDEAKQFFKDAVEWYGDYDNVIFETFNEPVTDEPHVWAGVREYHDELVQYIRDLGSDNLIIAGTPCFDQVFEGIKEDPVKDPANNIVYAMHFYSYTHKVDDGWLGKNFKVALEDELPIFVSEWGTSHSDGGRGGNAGTFDGNSADQWHAIFDQFGWSSAMWSIHSDGQSSAIWGNTGQADGYIKGLLAKHKEVASWRTGVLRVIPGLEEVDPVVDPDIDEPTPLSISGKKVTMNPDKESVEIVVEAKGGTEPYTFTWSKKSGNTVSISGGNSNKETVSGLIVGDYVILAQVTDGNGDKKIVEVAITVENSDTQSSDDSSTDFLSSLSPSSSSESLSSSPQGPPSSSDHIMALFERGSSVMHQTQLVRLQSSRDAQIHLGQSGVYTIALYDIMGNQIAQHTTAHAVQGDYSFSVDHSITQGLYVVKVGKIK